MDSHSLLQGIFPNPGSNPGLLPCRRIVYSLSHHGSPTHTSSVQLSCSVVSDSSRPHESQHARPPCPLPFPTVHGVLKARILKWLAILFSSGPHSVRPLHHDPPEEVEVCKQQETLLAAGLWGVLKSQRAT